MEDEMKLFVRHVRAMVAAGRAEEARRAIDASSARQASQDAGRYEGYEAMAIAMMDLRVARRLIASSLPAADISPLMALERELVEALTRP
jgi:hypothetical protein